MDHPKASKNILKLLFLGSVGAGKTCLIHKFVENHYKTYGPTIGSNFSNKEVCLQDEIVTLQIVDTSGLLQYNTTDLVSRGSHCCILVFDVTSSTSFRDLHFWRERFLNQVEAQNQDHIPFIVVGHKVDERNRQVSREEAMSWCSTIRGVYFEASAKDGVQVEACFFRAAEEALQFKKHTENTGGVAPPRKPSSSSCTCC